MVFVRIDGTNHKIKGYRSFELAPFTARNFDKEKLELGKYGFLCPDCKSNDFVSFSEAVCECDNCGRKLTFFWN